MTDLASQVLEVFGSGNAADTALKICAMTEEIFMRKASLILRTMLVDTSRFRSSSLSSLVASSSSSSGTADRHPSKGTIRSPPNS